MRSMFALKSPFRLAFLVAVVVLSATFAVACGDDDDDGGGSSGGGDGTATTIEVTMRDNSFSPKNIAVPAGKEITFNLANKGGAIHNMRTAGPDGRYDSGDDVVSQPDTIRAGQSGKLVATFQAGTVDFRCDFHPTEMTGRITVR